MSVRTCLHSNTWAESRYNTRVRSPTAENGSSGRLQGCSKEESGDALPRVLEPYRGGTGVTQEPLDTWRGRQSWS